MVRVLAAAALLALVSTPAWAACPIASFGEKKVAACARPECGARAAPNEIAAIERGVASEYIGLFINDGYARWVGLDLDRGEIVEVQRFASQRLAAAKKQLRKMKQSANHYRRESGRPATLDVVHRKPADPSALGDIVCAANALWAETADPKAGPASPGMSDSYNRLYLLDRGAAKAFGGPGELPDRPRRLRERLDAIQKYGSRS